MHRHVICCSTTRLHAARDSHGLQREVAGLPEGLQIAFMKMIWADAGPH